VRLSVYVCMYVCVEFSRLVKVLNESTEDLVGEAFCVYIYVYIHV
jgi:hypothetical protein